MSIDNAVVATPVAKIEPPLRGHGGRYEFLDALRGLAALAVVVQHCSERLWPAYFRFSQAHFGLGQFGVFAFFLVSGFIIPASLERGRSLGAFWVGRFFRLYPLFWACLTAAVLLHAVDRFGFPKEFLDNPVRNFVTNLTMGQFFIDGADTQMIGAAWSLSYELAFYLFLSLLLIAGFNQRSVPLALLAIGLIAPAVILPTAMVNGVGANTITRSIVAVATVMIAALFAYWAPDRRSALVAIGLAVITVPFVLNQPSGGPYTVGIFATMFVGTVLYRMTVGETTALKAWTVFGLAIGVIFVASLFVQPYTDPTTGAWVTWVKQPLTIIPAFLLFAGALLLRGRRFPRPFLFLGRISYSVYLAHALVLGALPQWTGSVAGIPATWLTFGTWVTGALLIATISYHAIEKPCHKLGHRVMTKIDARKRAGDTLESATV